MLRLLKSFSGFFLILFAAALGIALIWLPSWIIDQYNTINALGSIWGTVYLIIVGTGFVLLLGSSAWVVWRLWGRSISKRLRRARRDKNPSQLSREQIQYEIDENLQTLDKLGGDSPDGLALEQELRPLVDYVEQKREQQTLEIVAFGTISGGKSSVLNLLAGRDVFATEARGGTTITRNEIPWPDMDKVILVDTPGLGEVDGAEHINVAAESAKDADLILLVVDGPLRASEHSLLKQLAEMEKRVLICLNKTDWFTGEDLSKLMGQIQRQTASEVGADDIVAIQAEVGHRIRRRVLTDGTEIDEQIPVEPDIEPLADRLTKVINHEGKRLLMANLLLQSRGLVEKAKSQVQDSLDRQAWKIVDRYMWGAGGAAAIVPGPFIDLAVGIGISTKMIVDLAEVYQQKVDLETASRWIGEMGKNLVGVLGTNAAAPAIASVVGSMLKTVPIAGQLAGGALQGAVQALITKWIGAVFVEYFRNEMQTPEGGMAGLARRQWEQVTTIKELRKLITSARQKLMADN